MSKIQSGILVPCTACEGSGNVRIPYGYQQALHALGTKAPNVSGWWRSKELAERIGIGQTACCNRLAWLVQQGLAERADFGHRDQRWRPRYDGIAASAGKGKI